MSVSEWRFRFEAQQGCADVVKTALSQAGEPVIVDYGDGTYALPVALGERQALLIQLVLAGAVSVGLATTADIKSSVGEWRPL